MNEGRHKQGENKREGSTLEEPSDEGERDSEEDLIGPWYWLSSIANSRDFNVTTTRQCHHH